MAYKSKLDYMRDKLDEGSTKKGDVSNDAFQVKWEQVLAASEVMYSEESNDVQHYEAERTLWHYYWDTPFPGKDPQQEQSLQRSPSVRTSETPRAPPAKENPPTLPTPKDRSMASSQKDHPFTPEAESMIMSIRTKLNFITHLRGYHPMMGWNPKTGEPWLALRSQNVEKILKNGHKSLLMLEEQILRATSTPFTIYYCKFAQYVVYWPEFRFADMMDNQAAWIIMRDVWTFLYEWTNYDGVVPPIDVAYNEWMMLPDEQRQPIDFPAEFPGKWVEEKDDSNSETKQSIQPQQAQYSAPLSEPPQSVSQQIPQTVAPMPAPQQFQQQFQEPLQQQQQFHPQAQYQPRQYQNYHQPRNFQNSQNFQPPQNYQQPQAFQQQHNFRQPQYPQQNYNHHRPSVLAPRYNQVNRISKPGYFGIRNNFSGIPRGPRDQGIASPQPGSSPHGFRIMGRSSQGMGGGVGGPGFRNQPSPQQLNQVLTTGNHGVVSPASNVSQQTPNQASPPSPPPPPPPPPPGNPPSQRTKSRFYRRT